MQELFENALKESGIPTTEEEFKDIFQSIADDANLPIANNNKISAFWVFVTIAIVTPAKYLINYCIETIMPNSYVKTATGAFLDILGWSFDTSRKQGSKAVVKLTFNRNNGAQVLIIPKNTSVRTVSINGKIFRVTTNEEAVLEIDELSIDVLATAQEIGANYNLAAGYYSIMDSDVAGITQVTTKSNYIVELGTDIESDEDYRLRIRYKFASAGEWHCDAKYRSMVAERTGFNANRLFFKKYIPDTYDCRGAGSADMYVLFDSGDVPTALLADVNNFIRNGGNHGHGDDFKVFAMPESEHDVSLEIFFRASTTSARKAIILDEVEQIIRCAFRENKEYVNSVTQTNAYSRFSFSNLGSEIHNKYFEIETIIWDCDDIVSTLDVPRLDTLTISEGE